MIKLTNRVNEVTLQQRLGFDEQECTFGHCKKVKQFKSFVNITLLMFFFNYAFYFSVLPSMR